MSKGARSASRPSRQGFTLIELLVLMAIIGILAGTILPAFGRAKQRVAMINEINSARQIMLAWQIYADDHAGRVLPGYRYGYTAADRAGNPVEHPINARYPWRLAPYLAGSFEVMYVNRNRALLHDFAQGDDARYAYAASVFPSLGANAVFVGGDDLVLPPTPTAFESYDRFPRAWSSLQSRGRRGWTCGTSRSALSSGKMHPWIGGAMRSMRRLARGRWRRRFDRLRNRALCDSGYSFWDLIRTPLSNLGGTTQPMRSCPRATLMTTAGFQVAYDPTFDPVFSYLTNDHPDYLTDVDVGRPLEMFGAGFRNGITAFSWTESDPYAPEDGERTVYPVAWDEVGKEVDASMNVNYESAYEVTPFAVGTIAGVTAGDSVLEQSLVATLKPNGSTHNVKACIALPMATIGLRTSGAMIASLVLLNVAAAGNWPGFRGLSQSHSAETNLPLHWSSESVAGCQTDLPGIGQSSPVIWNGKVFVTSIDGPNKERLHLLCVALSSGKELWRKRWESSFPEKNSDYISKAAPTPLIDEERLYALFESGDLIAVSHDSDELWRRELATDYGPFGGNHGQGSSPMPTSRGVVVLMDHKGQSFVASFDTASGQTQRKTDRNASSAWSTPLVSRHAGVEELMVSASGSVVAYDAMDGSVRWSHEGIEGNNVPSPSTDGDLLLVGSRTKGANLALNLKSQGLQITWRAQEATSGFGSPLIQTLLPAPNSRWKPEIVFTATRLPTAASSFASAANLFALCPEPFLVPLLNPMTGSHCEAATVALHVSAVMRLDGSRIMARSTTS